MSLHNLKDVTYFDLNNEINIPVNGQIPLQKDQEALQAFLKENVEPNLKRFDSLKDRFDYLIDNNYYEADFVKKYDFAFIEKLYAYLNDQDFHFKSFMAAYKFYAQYALKSNDNDSYLESFWIGLPQTHCSLRTATNNWPWTLLMKSFINVTNRQRPAF